MKSQSAGLPELLPELLLERLELSELKELSSLEEDRPELRLDDPLLPLSRPKLPPLARPPEVVAIAGRGASQSWELSALAKGSCPRERSLSTIVWESTVKPAAIAVRLSQAILAILNLERWVEI